MTILADANIPARPLLGMPATSQRVIRRPGPPPSKEVRKTPSAVPMGPPPAHRPLAPPEPPPIAITPQPVHEVESERASHNNKERSRTLLHVIVSAAVAVSLFGILVCGLIALAKSEGYFPTSNQSIYHIVQRDANAEEVKPEESRTGSKDSSNVYMRDWFGEQEEPTAEEINAATDLLEERCYELQTDERGRVIGVRMPRDHQNKRFGPDIDEAQALAKLPHLRRLDLRNTLASVAVPIANRHGNVQVLVLEDQGDANSLQKLRGLKELHLVNSSVDASKLSRRGIKVVKSNVE